MHSAMTPALYFTGWSNILMANVISCSRCCMTATAWATTVESKGFTGRCPCLRPRTRPCPRPCPPPLSPPRPPALPCTCMPQLLWSYAEYSALHPYGTSIEVSLNQFSGALNLSTCKYISQVYAKVRGCCTAAGRWVLQLGFQVCATVSPTPCIKWMSSWARFEHDVCWSVLPDVHCRGLTPHPPLHNTPSHHSYNCHQAPLPSYPPRTTPTYPPRTAPTYPPRTTPTYPPHPTPTHQQGNLLTNLDLNVPTRHTSPAAPPRCVLPPLGVCCPPQVCAAPPRCVLPPLGVCCPP